MVKVADLVIDSDMICGQMVNVADLVINRDIIFDHNVDRSYIYAKPWPPQTWISQTIISNHRRGQIYIN